MNEKIKMNKIIILIIFISLVSFFIPAPDMSTVDGMILNMIILLIVGILYVVLGFIAKNQIKKTGEKGKIISIISIILGFCLSFLSVFSLITFLPMMSLEVNDEFYCQEAKECINNQDGTSSCYIQDFDFSIKCTTDKLNEEQLKK